MRMMNIYSKTCCKHMVQYRFYSSILPREGEKGRRERKKEIGVETGKGEGERTKDEITGHDKIMYRKLRCNDDREGEIADEEGIDCTM